MRKFFINCIGGIFAGLLSLGVALYGFERPRQSQYGHQSYSHSIHYPKKFSPLKKLGVDGLFSKDYIKWLNIRNICDKKGHYNPRASRNDFNKAFVAYFRTITTQRHMSSDLLEWILWACPDIDINSKDRYGHSAWYYATKTRASGQKWLYNYLIWLKKSKLRIPMARNLNRRHRHGIGVAVGPRIRKPS
jgi:hypothetical protein